MKYFYTDYGSANTGICEYIREYHHLTIQIRIVFLNYSRILKYQIPNTSIRLFAFCFEFLPKMDIGKKEKEEEEKEKEEEEEKKRRKKKKKKKRS